MPRRSVSENKDEIFESGIGFCSETGERLDDVRYNTRELIRASTCKNTWAQGVVRALFENDAEQNENLKHSAETVLSNLHERADKNTTGNEDEEFNLPSNFAKLEKRSKTIKVRKVKKKNIAPEEIDSNLISVIESIVDEKIAQA